ncbi:MAG TPA: hypothetical protein VGM69_19430 [Chloroflexota bacterium]
MELRQQYDQIWRRFREIRVVHPTLAAWRGRHRRASLVVRVNDPILFRRLDRIRAALAGLPFVVPVPDHGLQVPLLELGPVALRGARAGELRASDLPDVAEAIRPLLARTQPLVVDVSRVNATESEVFAELHRAEPLLELQAQLRAVLSPAAEGAPPLPWLPLGRFVAAGDAPALVRALEWFRDRPIGPIRIGAVTLVVSHRRARNICQERIVELPLGRERASVEAAG